MKTFCGCCNFSLFLHYFCTILVLFLRYFCDILAFFKRYFCVTFKWFKTVLCVLLRLVCNLGSDILIPATYCYSESAESNLAEVWSNAIGGLFLSYFCVLFWLFFVCGCFCLILSLFWGVKLHFCGKMTHNLGIECTKLSTWF